MPIEANVTTQELRRKLGNYLKTGRNTKNISRKTLAQQLNIRYFTESSLRNLEAGESVINKKTVVIITAICEKLTIELPKELSNQETFKEIPKSSTFSIFHGTRHT